MTTLILGAAGAAIGSATFGTAPLLFGLSGASLGWIAGSMVGAQLAPRQGTSISQEGPRLFDLKVQMSGYGQPVPRVFGRARLAGNVIWSSDIIEVSHVSTQTQGGGGGKGGGGGGGETTVTSTTYSYHVNLAIGICEGPIIGVRRIWANGKLVYSLGATADANTVVTSNSRAVGMRFYLGSTTQLADPLIEAYQGAGNVPGYRGLAYVVLENFQLADFGNRIPNFEFEVIGSAGTDASPVAVTTIPTTAGNQQMSYNEGTYAVGALSTTGAPAQTFRKRVYDLAGTLLSDQTSSYARSGLGSFSIPKGSWLGLILRSIATTPTWWNMEANEESSAAWLGASGSLQGGQMWKGSGYCYLFRQTPAGVYELHRIAIQGNVPAATPEKSLTLWSNVLATDYSFYASDGTLYVADSTSGVLYQYSDDLALLGQWTYATAGASHGPIYIRDDRFFAAQTGTKSGKLFKLNGDGTSTLLTTSSPDSGASTIAFPATPGIAIGLTKLLSVTPIVTTTTETLSNIVSDLCTESGLAVGDLDVSALTDSVTGYVLPRRAPLRAALEPLMAAYLFDGVESDGKLKFVKRGGASQVTIPNDDLGARPEGADPVDPVEHSRDEDVGLPAEMSVLFFNDNADYQQGAQYARRLASQASGQGTFELPVVLTDTQAKQIADAQLYDAWAARDAMTFTTGRKYAKYEPGDVVTITVGTQSVAVRLIKRDDGANGIIRWEAVYADAAVYSQSGSSQDAETPDATLSLPGPTNLELMDIPLLRDAHDTYGFYSAAAGYLAAWRGAQLFASADGGSTYDDVEAGLYLSIATIGYADTALGSTLPFGSEQFDETNTVDVTVLSGTLASVTRDQVLNGSNAMVLGSEVIQFKTATLLSAGKYRLSSLLRGRLGTTHAITGHAINERFVLLDSALRFIPHSSSELNVARDYKGVSIGSTLAGTEKEAFTDTGINLKPLAPVHIGGGRDASLNLTINWVRSTRLNAVWRDYVDAALGEDAESYQVDIMNGAAVVRTITTSTATASYTAAQQVTDFGSTQASVTVNVYQISAQVGRGYAGAGTI